MFTCEINRGKLIEFVVFSYLYQITQLGDADSEPEFSSLERLEEEDTFFFVPRKLKKIVLVDEMDSLSPITSCHIADLANEDTPQLYVTCGRGPRSTLRILRHGLEVKSICSLKFSYFVFAFIKVTEMAVSELPGNPNAVWTVKKRADGKILQTTSRKLSSDFLFVQNYSMHISSFHLQMLL